MKRLHMHIKVQDLAQSVTFYKTLFDAEPTVIKPDYAKWMLEDPAVNFALSRSSFVSVWIPTWLIPPFSQQLFVDNAKLTAGSSSIHLA
ncbi:MAG: hypothetical protein AAF723_07205, partial [Pseudomonadota bacterium]